ncbi:AAA family ATPase [Pseudomonas umsongensis]|uniref:AAA domain-containing protein n=1 Tax=Pseudomonas umsongensis TaxID=198618 RepID=A0AAE7DCU4_9PSED|nr:AAA family ATPase [Pseudomonas umsongensis]QJC77728.1 hypothetical protein HGP31_05255 [Pseudomonas umsongensis]
MKLLNIKIFPNGQSGWGSKLLKFGRDITQLYGPNGCGKTPLVQSIAFCLGFPSVFRNDIYNRCKYVELRVSSAKGELVLRRIYSRDLDVEVVDSKGNVRRFLNERDYSVFVFEWLGLTAHNLVTTGNQLGAPYLSTLLPIYYLDQDVGYSEIYCPPAKFIKDQFSEMMRMVLDLPVKNSFDIKKERFKAKERLDYLDKDVQTLGRMVGVARGNASTIKKTRNELESEIEKFELEVEQLQSAGASRDDSLGALDRLISTHRSRVRDISSEIYQLQKRNEGIGTIVHEINTEVETLNLNEEARRVFLSFREICGANFCQLFSASSDAYSKNLLYLRDQIKDLERNASLDEVRIEEMLRQKESLELVIGGLVDERNASIDRSEISALVQAITKIKSEIFALQLQLSELDRVKVIEEKHFGVILERDKALSLFESFSVERSSSPDLIKVRADLRRNFIEWLDVLHTHNVSKDITFKDDFTPLLGVETIAQLKGSTKIRAVLAYHAAVFQTFAEKNVAGFRFLILDTPKQHEIHNDDLGRYLDALKTLCASHDVQVVFSTTEYHHACDEHDMEWNPSYPGEDQDMFLKVGGVSD